MVVQLLARFICFHSVSTELEQLMKEYSDVSKVDTEAPIRRQKRFLICCRDKTKDKDDDDLVEQLNSHCRDKNTTINSVSTPGAALEQQFKELRRSIERFEAKADARVQKQRKEYIFSLEWRTVGLILDRFFFYIYIGLIGISLAVFFPRPLEPQDAE